MTVLIWAPFFASFLSRKWWKGREQRRWRNGKHWQRKTSAGAKEGGAALPGSCAPVPVDSAPDVPAAAAETAGGRNSDQDSTE